MPKKDANGIDTYDNNNYKAPIHAIIGMAGFKLDSFPSTVSRLSLIFSLSIYIYDLHLSSSYINCTVPYIGRSDGQDLKKKKSFNYHNIILRRLSCLTLNLKLIYYFCNIV